MKQTLTVFPISEQISLSLSAAFEDNFMSMLNQKRMRGRVRSNSRGRGGMMTRGEKGR
jgi:hypothetical protein